MDNLEYTVILKWGYSDAWA